MSDDPPVLDLDSVEPDDELRPTPVRLREVRAPLWIVALVALGVAVVAVGLTRAWDTDQVRRGQQETVRLLVAAPPDGGLTGGGDGSVAVFRGVLLVTNTGPLAIELGRVRGTSAAITLSGDLQDQELPVDATLAVDVELRLDCSRWEPNDPVDLTLGVTTKDGVHRSKTDYLILAATEWGNAIQVACSTL